MTVNLAFIGGAGWQFFDDNGDPLSGGKIYTYAAGTTTPLTTYTSRDGNTPNTNPIILDSAGRPPAQIWATEGVLYKYVLAKSNNVLVRTYDNIGGTIVASSLQQDLANTTDNTLGDALIGFRQSNNAGFLLGSVGRTLNNKMQEIVSVKDFGAVGDNVVDDTAAIQAAIDYLTNGRGGTLHIPPGLYRVTNTLSVGLPIVTNYTFMTTRTSELPDATIQANSILPNVAANNLKNHIDFEFAPGATLVADWTPATPTPVLAYNLVNNTQTSFGNINNATIVSAVMIQNGVYNLDAVSTPQSNNIIGIFASYGCKQIKTSFLSGIEHGIISMNGFWTHITDMYVWRAGGICLNIVIGNALKVDNLSFWYSNKGVVFDGDASEIRGIHTQQVAQDLIVYACDCCVFGPGYLEDVSPTDGAGTYAVTLGHIQNDVRVKSSTFEGLRVGSTRPNKGAFRIWDTRNSTFDICRSYAKAVLFDNQSSGLLNQCDFLSTSTNRSKWQVFQNGALFSTFATTGSNFVVQGPWMFNVLGITTGSIAPSGTATYDYTLPTVMDTLTAATAHFNFTSGGPVQLVVTARVVGPAPYKVRFTFFNPTAGSLSADGSNLTLTVFAAL